MLRFFVWKLVFYYIICNLMNIRRKISDIIDFTYIFEFYKKTLSIQNNNFKIFNNFVYFFFETNN